MLYNSLNGRINRGMEYILHTEKSKNNYTIIIRCCIAGFMLAWYGKTYKYSKDNTIACGSYTDYHSNRKACD